MSKICFITSSRADYGLMMRLMKFIKYDKNLKLQLIVTGSHLSYAHGQTYKEILKDGFSIDRKCNLKIKNYKPNDICNYIGLTTKKISKEINELKPNLIVLLGDRYEIFAAASAALVHRVPICHLHGGEVTSGSIDDSFRHSITKMSNIHFVSNKFYRKRIIQLGENPKSIFVVGGFGVDLIKNIKFLKKKDIEKKLNFRFMKKNLLVAYHPETIDRKKTIRDFSEILKSLNKFKDIQIIFTSANADVDGDIINRMIKNFVYKNKSHACIFKSMGQINYLSTLRLVDGIIGNSSSGILEAPTFSKPTINIGKRQDGRLKAKSVINTAPKSKNIIKSIKKIYSIQFKNNLLNVKNPYGCMGASIKTFKVLKKIEYRKFNDKTFFDIYK